MHIERVMHLRNALEARLLWSSLVATVLIAGLGILLGLLARSPAIIFDGFFSLIDVAITWLTLKVARLVAIQAEHRRFQFGFWHLEPLVIALNASVLIVLVAYAFLSAVNSILKGGYEPELGIALVYAALVAAISFLMWWWMGRHAERIDSGLVRLDVKAWLISALISTALLIAFAVALAMRESAAADLIRFVDPLVLALIALALLPLPFRDAIESFSEILQMSPPEMDAQVRTVMTDFVRRHGFLDYRAYSTKSGRARFIEIAVLVPSDLCLPVSDIDALREEIGTSIGDPGPDRWLTIIFTADATQL
ncbi:MAG: cation transporter [Sphingobacteriia bacterium]|nr:cation transporter [Sphingobacteriia bacterium]NCC38516.1 cation transporter [Gammaproteobacteria bacterium]